LWSLNGLQSLDMPTLTGALRDPHPGVRENAVKLAENAVKVAKQQRQTYAGLATVVAAMADDDEPRVRFQVAFTLGEMGTSVETTLAVLARRYGGDRWMRAAILSSAGDMAVELFDELIGAHQSGKRPDRAPAFWTTETGSAILGELATVIGSRNRPADVDRALRAIAESPIGKDPGSSDRLLVQLGIGLKRAGGRLAHRDSKSPAGVWLEARLSNAKKVAGDASPGEGQRLGAIELLSAAPTPATRELYLSLIAPEQSEAIQIAAVRALSEDPDPGIGGELLNRFRALTPEVRRVTLDALFAREGRTLALLEAASRDDISLADVEPTRRDVLLKHKNEAIRNLASQVFATSGTTERKAVVAQYQAALTLAAKTTEGQAVFEKNCANCHQLAGKGYAIGPNLASSPARDPAALLAHILDPNQYVLPNYVQYVVVDKQGRSYTGLLAAQTATSITLKKEKDEAVTILRSDVDELATTGKSLMPEGLEKNIPPQEMAHLLAYLKDTAASGKGDANAERDFGTLPGLIEPKQK
jgi:putative heme-binding domain-containing protein